MWGTLACGHHENKVLSECLDFGARLEKLESEKLIGLDTDIKAWREDGLENRFVCLLVVFPRVKPIRWTGAKRHLQVDPQGQVKGQCRSFQTKSTMDIVHCSDSPLLDKETYFPSAGSTVCY